MSGREDLVAQIGAFLDSYAGGHYMAKSCASAVRAAFGQPEAPHRCSICGGRTFVQMDIRQFNGTFAPGPERRCIECKTTFTAQAYAALRGLGGAEG